MVHLRVQLFLHFGRLLSDSIEQTGHEKVCDSNKQGSVSTWILSWWVFLTQTRLGFFQNREQTIERLNMCPTCLNVLNRNNFYSVFNLFCIVTISLCNKTDIGNGSFVFMCRLYLWPLIGKGVVDFCQYPFSLTTIQPHALPQPFLFWPPLYKQ